MPACRERGLRQDSDARGPEVDHRTGQGRHEAALTRLLPASHRWLYPTGGPLRTPGPGGAAGLQGTWGRSTLAFAVGVSTTRKCTGHRFSGAVLNDLGRTRSPQGLRLCRTRVTTFASSAAEKMPAGSVGCSARTEPEPGAQ